MAMMKCFVMKIKRFTQHIKKWPNVIGQENKGLQTSSLLHYLLWFLPMQLEINQTTGVRLLVCEWNTTSVNNKRIIIYKGASTRII